jgi:hypothetical protein
MLKKPPNNRPNNSNLYISPTSLSALFFPASQHPSYASNDTTFHGVSETYSTRHVHWRLPRLQFYTISMPLSITSLFSLARIRFSVMFLFPFVTVLYYTTLYYTLSRASSRSGVQAGTTIKGIPENHIPKIHSPAHAKLAFGFIFGFDFLHFFSRLS